VRRVLEDDSTFERALASLVASELMAPCYLTLCGTTAGEGAVVTRQREGGEGNHVRHLTEGAKPWLVQANMDCWRDPRGPALDGDRASVEPGDHSWQDICDSRARRAFVDAALTGCATPPTLEDLWLIASTPPALASDTVYTCAMVPAAGTLVTRVVATADMRRAGRARFGTVAF
jgi:hypothetical protein